LVVCSNSLPATPCSPLVYRADDLESAQSIAVAALSELTFSAGQSGAVGGCGGVCDSQDVRDSGTDAVCAKGGVKSETSSDCAAGSGRSGDDGSCCDLKGRGMICSSGAQAGSSKLQPVPFVQRVTRAWVTARLVSRHMPSWLPSDNTSPRPYPLRFRCHCHCDRRCVYTNYTHAPNVVLLITFTRSSGTTVVRLRL
jgi:hypothetical protein